MKNILEKIIEDKKETLKVIKEKNSLDFLENKIKNIDTFLDFKDKISKNKILYTFSPFKAFVSRTIDTDPNNLTKRPYSEIN